MAATGFAILAYLIGSISFAIITSKLFKLPDPRSFGSKNPGATNMLRTGNKTAAALTLLGDAAKGWLAVFIAQSFAASYQLNDEAIATVILATILGHMWPVFFNFYGGKGVATALGILIAVNPPLGLSCLGVWLVVLKVSKISSLSALSAAICAPIFTYIAIGNKPQLYAIVAVSCLLIYRHKRNIKDLLKGSESKVSKT
ncbi:glycerol-3-phosphate 1-O-acyltransferase PlsY [Leeia sp. TBRC 13508]|uniref:Glycerol-3-phosphate acyltransferase n=1 Tax=Leeia speluncae TaxID=2884804 RepID=A0ABS8D4R2_9NEIS|nr:glycerol-3-phosphate 1-O-acyltransferase PlsY [Leeia speluncae]MCB6183185.1 glycerol-3-phosphate 1-O-acyltransferase PlsY [Leeia speluncae]